MPFADEHDASRSRTKLFDLKHDPEYMLKSGNTLLSLDSTHTVHITRVDAVVTLKMLKSGQ